METIYPETQNLLTTNYITPKNSLQRNQKQLKIIKALTIEFSKLENKMLLNKDIETLRYLCSLLEDAVKKKDKIDKESCIIEVYKQVFGESNVDIDFIKRGIEFLLDNKKIKKLSLVKKYIYPVGKFFFRRFF
jgi:hypothetical protein